MKFEKAGIRRPLSLRPIFLFAITVMAASAAGAATITVTTTADDLTPNDGGVSLREAITAINAGNDLGDPNITAQAPGTFGTNDTINFNIPGAGVKTINVGSDASASTLPLPTIVKPVTINGYTQGVASTNTLANGENAVILVELNVTSVAAGSTGLQVGLGGDGTTIEGLVINRFAANGSGNGGSGILLLGANNCVITGNFIGTNAAGAAVSANGGIGVDILSSGGQGGGTTVGGTTPDKRNVISGNNNGGVRVGTGNLAGTTIQGNFIGTNAAGTAAIPNFIGIRFLSASGSGSLVGGTVAGARNIVSGNSLYGVDVINGSANVVVQGNFIGTDVTGTLPIGNTTVGLDIADGFSGPTTNVLVGGTVAGAGNLIANTTSGPGVDIRHVFAIPCTGNAVLGNSIFGNSTVGIDLNDDGVTANDGGSPPDQDAGDNNLQNFPVLSTAVASGSGTTITGTLSSTPSTQFRVEFFSNPACSSSGNGEGKLFVGFQNVTTNGSGAGTINFATGFVVTPGQVVTATATDPNNNTSEFSACVTVTGTIGGDHAPVANNDSYSTPINVALVVAAPGVLTNDTDADSDPLTADKNTDPANGSFVLNADGSFTYTPNSGFSGTDSFTYHANDGQLDSNVATVTITVGAALSTVPIPTLGSIGLGLLGVLVAFAGLFVMRRLDG